MDNENENDVKGWTDIEDIAEYFRECFLRWLGHLKRMNVESVTRRVHEKRIVGNAKRERPKENPERDGVIQLFFLKTDEGTAEHFM